MQELSYGDFSEAVHEGVSSERIPLDGSVEVTRRCNLSCTHCYVNLPANDEKARQSELSYEEHCRILDEITEAGCLWLLYTGGEIFLRADFLDIYTYAKQKGLLITLFTNGTLITPKIADHLDQWRPFSVEITLYGRTRETHERVTGVPGSHENCMRGIGVLLERNIPLRLKSVVMTLNAHELRDLKQFVEGELGLEFRFDAMINPRIDRSRGPLAVRLSPEEVVALDMEDPKRLSEWRRLAETTPVSPRRVGKGPALYQCGGGLASFAVDAAGNLTLCALDGREAYDLRSGSFEEGWGRFIGQMRDRHVTRMTRCVGCRIHAVCDMCPANGTLETGDPEEPVAFLCQVAHLRAKALGLTAKPHGV